jgi:hypothetical protein
MTLVGGEGTPHSEIKARSNSFRRSGFGQLGMRFIRLALRQPLKRIEEAPNRLSKGGRLIENGI